MCLLYFYYSLGLFGFMSEDDHIASVFLHAVNRWKNRKQVEKGEWTGGGREEEGVKTREWSEARKWSKWGTCSG